MKEIKEAVQVIVSSIAAQLHNDMWTNFTDVLTAYNNYHVKEDMDGYISSVLNGDDVIKAIKEGMRPLSLVTDEDISAGNPWFVFHAENKRVEPLGNCEKVKERMSGKLEELALDIFTYPYASELYTTLYRRYVTDNVLRLREDGGILKNNEQ